MSDNHNHHHHHHHHHSDRREYVSSNKTLLNQYRRKLIGKWLWWVMVAVAVVLGIAVIVLYKFA